MYNVVYTNMYLYIFHIDLSSLELPLNLFLVEVGTLKVHYIRHIKFVRKRKKNSILDREIDSWLVLNTEFFVRFT